MERTCPAAEPHLNGSIRLNAGKIQIAIPAQVPGSHSKVVAAANHGTRGWKSPVPVAIKNRDSAACLASGSQIHLPIEVKVSSRQTDHLGQCGDMVDRAKSSIPDPKIDIDLARTVARSRKVQKSIPIKIRHDHSKNGATPTEQGGRAKRSIAHAEIHLDARSTFISHHNVQNAVVIQVRQYRI